MRLRRCASTLSRRARVADFGGVRPLLDAGAEPNRVDERDGGFPLLMAALGGHRDAVEQLLAHHAIIDQVHAQTDDGARRPSRRSPIPYWRSWRASHGPDGPQGELTWIEGPSMARGRVVTPNDGIGLRLLPGSQTLARNIQWAVPQYMHNGDGQWSALRVLGELAAVSNGAVSD